MNKLCIIPARGGSKRIPHKNIKEFNGKPIISYVIETVKKTNLFDEIMVSTDSQSIAEIAKTNGAKVPFLRTSENANDFATLSDVLLEVLEKYRDQGKEFESICCILPTAALITSNIIAEAYDKLDNEVSTVLPVLKFSYPIQRALKNKEGLLFMNQQEHLNTRSQDLEEFYHDSGQFYWLKTSNFLKEKKIFTDKTKFIELEEYQAQDVDTPEDWKMLEIKYKFLQNL